MEERIKKIMSAVFEISPVEINANSSPENIQSWDSLKHINMVSALEDEFGIAFTDDEIIKIVTFSAIKANLKNKLP